MSLRDVKQLHKLLVASNRLLSSKPDVSVVIIHTPHCERAIIVSHKVCSNAEQHVSPTQNIKDNYDIVSEATSSSHQQSCLCQLKRVWDKVNICSWSTKLGSFKSLSNMASAAPGFPYRVAGDRGFSLAVRSPPPKTAQCKHALSALSSRPSSRPSPSFINHNFGTSERPGYGLQAPLCVACENHDGDGCAIVNKTEVNTVDQEQSTQNRFSRLQGL